MIQLTIGAIVHLMATKTALNIDKGLVGRVAAILGTKGTTETIDAALRDVENCSTSCPHSPMRTWSG